MLKYQLRFSFWAFCLFVALPSFAQEESVSSSNYSLSLLRARISSIGVIQPDGSSYVMMPQWSPKAQITESLYARGILGATMIHTQDKTYFPIAGAYAAAGFNKGIFYAEVGPGVQYWGLGSTQPGIYLGLGLDPHLSWFESLHPTIFFSLAYAKHLKRVTNTYALGIELTFGEN